MQKREAPVLCIGEAYATEEAESLEVAVQGSSNFPKVKIPLALLTLSVIMMTMYGDEVVQKMRRGLLFYEREN